MTMRLCFYNWHQTVLRLPRDCSTIACAKHMASLRRVVHTIIGPGRIQVPYQTIADVDAIADVTVIQV